MNAIKNLLKSAVTDSMVEALRDGDVGIDDELIKSFVYVNIDDKSAFKFLKAIGLIHFEGNKEAQLVVNDFIGVLSDMYDEGEIAMNENQRRA